MKETVEISRTNSRAGIHVDGLSISKIWQKWRWQIYLYYSAILDFFQHFDNNHQNKEISRY